MKNKKLYLKIKKYSKNHLQPFSNAFENLLKSRDKGR